MEFEVGDIVKVKDIDQMKAEGLQVNLIPQFVVDRAGRKAVVSEVFPASELLPGNGYLLSGFRFHLICPEYLELIDKKTEANMIGLSRIVLGNFVSYSMVRYCNGHSLPINAEEYATDDFPIVLDTQNIMITQNIQSLGLEAGDVLEGVIKNGNCYVPNKLPFIGMLAEDEYKII